MIYALSNENFSEYIKTLIKEDKERKEKIFTDKERAEIERIVDNKFKKQIYIIDQTEQRE